MYEFKNLVFEGGGVKGIGYGGALQKLDEFGILSKIERVAGASAGAITATLLAVGYTAAEITDILINTDYPSFADNGDIIDDAIRFFQNYGWHKGEAFEAWLGDYIERQTGKKNLTFMELHRLKEQNEARKTKVKRIIYKDLYAIGTNLSRQSSEIYSYETTPDLEVIRGVRISMSIPFYFQCVRLNGDILVDGGLTLNYPIDIFDNERYLSNVKRGEALGYTQRDGIVFNHETLGFRLKPEKGTYKKIDGVLDYTSTVINLLSQTALSIPIHKNDWGRTISINTGTVGTTEFDLGKEKIDMLLENGRIAVSEYFARKKAKKPSKISRINPFKLYTWGLKKSGENFLSFVSSLKSKDFSLKKESVPQDYIEVSETKEKKFEKFIHEQIPITEYMNFTVKKVESSEVQILTRLTSKINHKPTAFGGGINSLMTVCGWAMVIKLLEEVDKKANIVIQKNSIEYLLPIENDFIATCRAGDTKKIEKFIKSYRKWGKARIEMEVEIKSKNGIAAKFKGTYAAFK